MLFLKMLKKNIIKDPNKEHCIIGWAEYFNSDFKILIDDVIILENNASESNKFFLPKQVSINLLLNSKANNIIPIIAHTHLFYTKEELISFSNQDNKFINSFINLGNKLKGIECYIFILSDGNQYLLKIISKNDIKEIRGII